MGISQSWYYKPAEKSKLKFIQNNLKYLLLEIRHRQTMVGDRFATITQQYLIVLMCRSVTPVWNCFCLILHEILYIFCQYPLSGRSSNCHVRVQTYVGWNQNLSRSFPLYGAYHGPLSPFTRFTSNCRKSTIHLPYSGSVKQFFSETLSFLCIACFLRRKRYLCHRNDNISLFDLLVKINSLARTKKVRQLFWRIF